MEAAVFLFKEDRGLGFDAIGDQIVVFKNHRQRHGETGRMGRANQLFGVGAVFAFETGVKAVGLVADHAGLGGDMAFALFEVACPFCGA